MRRRRAASSSSCIIRDRKRAGRARFMFSLSSSTWNKKKKIAKIIQILGIGLTELVIDLDTSLGTFNSIEWSRPENKIWLHMFHEDDDIQITFDFDAMNEQIAAVELNTILLQLTFNISATKFMVPIKLFSTYLIGL